MSINISAFRQNFDVKNTMPAFKGKNVAGAVKGVVSEQKPNANKTFTDFVKSIMQIGGWVMLFALLTGGWISSCVNKDGSNKSKTEVPVDAPATSVPQIENVK